MTESGPSLKLNPCETARTKTQGRSTFLVSHAYAETGARLYPDRLASSSEGPGMPPLPNTNVDPETVAGFGEGWKKVEEIQV